MAKCVALWSGNDSTGRCIEVALSVDGQYFSRAYEFNGYQNAWTRWVSVDDVKHPTTYRNNYDDCVYYYNEDKTPFFKVIEWGFMNLRGDYVEGCRYRLPKA